MNHLQIVSVNEDGSIHYDMSGENNACSGCGGCCRHYRVSFYHGELDSQPGGYVPADMAMPVTPFRACMKGTENGSAPCIALQPDLRCGIYAQRPSVCREFPAFMPDGTVNPECIRLRELLGIDIELKAG